MKHLGTLSLETDRLLLRPLKPDDAKAMYTNWATDKEVARYVTWAPHANLAETQELMAFWASQYDRPDFYTWGIELKATGQLIGTFAFVGVSDRDQVAELGYALGKNWWHQGYATEAGLAILAFGFDRLSLNRIQAVHDDRTPASGRVLEKLGMTYEGTIRQARLVKGKFVTLCHYGILVEDWTARTN